MSTAIVRQCLTCQRAFRIKASRAAEGKGQYCSRLCRRPRPIEQRFFRHVDINGPIPSHRPELGNCHVWIGQKRKGYGRFAMGSAREGTRGSHGSHRVAFLIGHGRWPSPNALHKCDNPSCVRVDHLFEGSAADNVADMFAKTRQKSPFGEAHGVAKLDVSKVQSIRAAAAAGETPLAIAKRLGISRQTVYDIIRRRYWAHVA